MPCQNALAEDRSFLNQVNAVTGVDVQKSNAFRTELAAQLREEATSGPLVSPISIKNLLEWAFRKEKAVLRLGEGLAMHGTPLRGVGIEYLMMQRGAAGCRIDGGGMSFPHDDAELVADAVACLDPPIAKWVAEFARAGTQPDAMIGVTPRFEPVAWQENQYGRTGATVDLCEIDPVGGKPVPRRNRKGAIVYDPIRVVPIVLRPSPDQIGRARRAWLQWWDALFELREALKTTGMLTRWTLTNTMPPAAPWRENV